MPQNKCNHNTIKIFNSLLTVVEVGIGGNANAGRYFYDFNPKVIEVADVETEVVIGFSEVTPIQFHIYDFFSTDSFHQIKHINIHTNKRSVSFIHKNLHKCITNILLQIQDTKEKVIVECDPQVVNRPPVEDHYHEGT